MKHLKFILPALLLLAFSTVITQESCVGSKVVFNAHYDSVMITRVEGMKTLTASLYTNIQASTDKSYEVYKPVYNAIDTGLAELLADESKRSKNEAIKYQAKTTLEFLRQFAAEHSNKGSIANTQAKAYAKYMNDIFDIWLKTERSLNR